MSEALAQSSQPGDQSNNRKLIYAVIGIFVFIMSRIIKFIKAALGRIKMIFVQSSVA
jgi:hypothetical protein